MRVVGLWFIHTFQRPRIPITADYCAHMLPHVRFPCQGPRRFACGAAAGAVAVGLTTVLPLALGAGCWVLGAGAVVLELWCLRCGAGAGAVVPALWCCGAGAGAVVLVLWCWVLPAAWRAQFPCARIGCIPHEVQGHMRTRAGHAAYALAPTHKPRVVGYRTRPRGCFEVRAKRGTVEASPTPLRNPT